MVYAPIPFADFVPAVCETPLVEQYSQIPKIILLTKQPLGTFHAERLYLGLTARDLRRVCRQIPYGWIQQSASSWGELVILLLDNCHRSVLAGSHSSLAGASPGRRCAGHSPLLRFPQRRCPGAGKTAPAPRSRAEFTSQATPIPIV